MSVPRAYIGRKIAASLLHGPRTAAAIGRPLNTYVTINLWQLGIEPETAYRAFRELRDNRFQRWSTYTPAGAAHPRNGPPTYVWVIEAPGTLPHVHWMLHVAPGAAAGFAAALTRWLQRLAGRKSLPEGIIDLKPATNPEGLKLYFAKAIEPRLGLLWNIQTVASGIVFERRAGTSRNLGPAEWRPRKVAWLRARKAAA